MKTLLLTIALFCQSLLLLSAPDGWAAKSSAFEYSFTVAGVVEINGEPAGRAGDLIGAFVDGQCRGVADATYIEVFDKYYFFLTVFSNDYSGEEVIFKYYSTAEDSVYVGFEPAVFSDGASYGTASEPYVFYNGVANYSINITADSVAENLPAGTEIGLLSAYKNEIAGEYQFDLLSEKDNFYVEAGTLYSARSFDFETQSEYEIQLVAYDADSAEVFEKTVSIYIKDVEESHELLFSAESFAENNEPSLLIGEFSVDGETGLVCSLTENAESDNQFFFLQSNRLYADTVFNYEDDSIFTIEVLSELDGKQLTTEFTLKVTDVEEIGIIYLQTDTVLEAALPPSVIGKLWVEDEDLDDEYTLVLVDTSGDSRYFSIVDSMLVADTVFDYETKNMYTVTVKAQTSDGETVIADFVIRVIDQPEGAMTLSNSIVTENNSAPSFVGKLNLIAEDLTVQYKFVLSSTDSLNNKWFYLAGDSLMTDSVLNYEENQSLTISVFAESETDTVYSQFAITVVDVEERSLTCNLDSVLENNPTPLFIDKLVVNDPDMQEIEYSFVLPADSLDNAAFYLVADSLMTDSVFDYETKSMYEVKAYAISGSDTLTVMFPVNIIDSLESGTTTVMVDSVLETAEVGALVGSISVYSADSLSYSIEIDSSYADWSSFVLENDSIFTDTVLNYSQQESYTLGILVVSSLGDTAKYSFNVELKEVKDKLKLTISNNAVSEHAPISSLVGVLSMSIVDASFLSELVEVFDYKSFYLSGDSLFSNSLFDFEKQDKYQLLVKAKTDTSEILQGFMIEISNQPEKGEMVLSNAMIAENAGEGALIGELMMADSSYVAAYVFETVGTEDFYLEGSELYASTSFNYEARSEYSFAIRSISSGDDTLTQTFHISVSDENEAPYNLTISNSNISEDAELGTLVANIIAFDEDAGDELTFSIVTPIGDYIEAFEVRDGAIYTVAELDYSQASSHTIILKAEDKEGASVEQYYQIKVQSTTAVDERGGLTVFPNPVADVLHVGSVSDITKVIVLDVSGAELIVSTGSDVDVSELQAGIYFVKVLSNDIVYTSEFLIE